MYKKLLFFFIFTPFVMYAQEVISTQGSYFSNSNGSVSFTLGELVIETINTPSNILTQGFNQNNDAVLSINDLDTNLQVLVYPNPVKDILQLDIPNFSGINYRIYDLQGRMITNNKVKNKITNVKTSNYSNGIYLLILFNENNQKLKTYRIIKN